MIGNISCDRCGYYDSAEKFPTLETPQSLSFLKQFGWDYSKPEYKGHIQTMYAGAICPGCGNFSQLDFDPDNNKLERLVGWSE